MKYMLNFIFSLCVSGALFAQVGIGTTSIDASAVFQIENTTKGLLVPRMTQAQRIAIAAPATSLLVFQTDNTSGFYYYNGSVWSTFSGGSGWSTLGNSGTTPATNKLGTTDGEDFSIVANNLEGIRVASDGKIGINTALPAAVLNITGPNIPAKTPALRIQDGNEANGFVLVSDANGNGVWTDPNTLGGTEDDDWVYATAATGNTAPIYRIGDVHAGVQGSADASLHVENPGGIGDPEGLGIGSDEYITDYLGEAWISHNVVPKDNDMHSIGSSSYKWDTIYTVNNPISTSDEREKKAIKPLRYGLTTLLKLRPVSYIWKNEIYGKTVLKDKQKSKKIGFIAQELQKEVPEIVEEFELKSNSKEDKKNNRFAVRYSELLPILVNATKEHQAIIDKIDAQQEQIESLIKELK